MLPVLKICSSVSFFLFHLRTFAKGPYEEVDSAHRCGNQQRALHLHRHLRRKLYGVAERDSWFAYTMSG